MKSKSNLQAIVPFAIGEISVAVLTVIGAMILPLFTDYSFNISAIFGAILGAVVIIFNFAFLTISVNRAVNSYLEIRGTKEMTEEEAEKFTQENSMVIQNKIKTSYMLRMATMTITLLLAFLVKHLFNPVCVAIPMLTFRPVIYITEMINGKAEK